MTSEDLKRCNEICLSVPGYSGSAHYCFFQGLLADPALKSLLILGVYHGRDICFLLDILKRHHPGRFFRIVGVDKFTDTPCADWPADRRTLGWEKAGYGKPPSLESTLRNTSPLEDAARVEIHQMEDEDFLLGAEEGQFDVIYYDTSHDKKSLVRQLKQSRSRMHAGTVLCGDDFRDEGTWGVVSAVRESFNCYSVYYDYIWMSKAEYLK